MNWIKRFFYALGRWFTSGQWKVDADKAIDFVAEALPFVYVAADIITKVTPTPLDDLAFAAVKAALPSIMDDREHTDAELKLAMLVYVESALQAKFPQLTTTLARLFAQAAVTKVKGQVA